MKIKSLLLSLIFCLTIFFSCSNNFDKIEIPVNKIEQVKNSMRYVKKVLKKSTFDTLAIKNTWIQNEIYHQLMYKSTLNRDSLAREVGKHIDSVILFPFNKGFSYSNEGFISLNNRQMGNDFKEFKKNTLTCKEFENLTLKDKIKFVESVAILLDNNIWSCWEYQYSQDKKAFCFDYSDVNLYVNAWQARYLYLAEDIQDDLIIRDRFNDEYKLIDKRNGLNLYKLIKKYPQ